MIGSAPTAQIKIQPPQRAAVIGAPRVLCYNNAAGKAAADGFKMPKKNNTLTRAKTSPGISYTLPPGKLVTALADPDQELFSYVVEIDPLEEILLTEAAREVVRETYPGFTGTISLPISTARGRTTLLAHGRFPPTIRGADGLPTKTIKPGVIVELRVMLKAWRSTEGVTVAAFPSRIDVQVKHQSLARKKADQPAAPVPVPATKPATRKPPKPTFSRAELEAHARRRLAELAARGVTAPKPKAPRKPKAKTPLASFDNVVVLFPTSRTRH